MKADDHLTYIATPGGYDVYADGGGLGLGWVERRDGRHWMAYAYGPEGRKASGDARWVAATRLWPRDEIGEDIGSHEAAYHAAEADLSK